jgi:hypothetical protein
VKKLEGDPFALIGVNTNMGLEPKKLKEVMDKEKLNWRSFVMHGAINAKWNDPGTPSYYLVDHKGIIRYKWVGNPGEKAIDTALDRLIKEARTGGKSTPK